MFTVSPCEDHDVAYVTDIEGSWDKLRSFCDDNPRVALDAHDAIALRDGVTLVFGGDAIDRGPWSRKVVRTLLAAKARYPDRVVLLAGNRDLNKMRLVRELAGHPSKKAPPEIAAAAPPVLLKWLMQHTMGAQDAFAFRQAELAYERLPCDDDDVTLSFLTDLEPDHDLGRYLKACQLSYRSGCTLFVHGGIAREALTSVPDCDVVQLAHWEVDRWMRQLEAFYREQVDAFSARAMTSDGRPAWEPAIIYQAPRKGHKTNPGSVVYGRMSDDLNNPVLPSPDVIDALQRCGVHRVVVGHTPSGDVPTVVRTTRAQPFEVVTADNSRGRTALASQLVVRDAGIQWRGTVVADTLETIEMMMQLPRTMRDSPVGKRTAGGELVVGRSRAGWHLFRYLPGYAVAQRVVPSVGPVGDATPPLTTAPPQEGT